MAVKPLLEFPISPLSSFTAQQDRSRQAHGLFIPLQHHVVTWLPQGNQDLVVTFDNLAALSETVDRKGWGQDFLLQQNFDVLAVQIRSPIWFRDGQLIVALTRLRAMGVFHRYRRLSFYGASMGAFGALAFSALVPGSTVLAFAPQFSLDPQLVDFDDRYRLVSPKLNWNLPYSNAAQSAQSAKTVYVAYDPLNPIDLRHAQALQGPNTLLLPMPYMGHKLPPSLKKMGILTDIALAGLTGTLDLPQFYRTMRKRHSSLPWQISLLERAVERGHKALALKVAKNKLQESRHWKLRHLVQNIERTIPPSAP